MIIPTLFSEEVYDGVQFRGSVHIRQLVGERQREVDDPQPPLARAVGVQQRRLDVHAGLRRQLVVVFDLHADGLVRV